MEESLKRALGLTHEQKILLRLVHGELVAQSELMDLLYADDPDGGPIRAGDCLRQAIDALRKTLRAEGWDIELVKCYGLDVGKGRIFDGCPESSEGRSLKNTVTTCAPIADESSRRLSWPVPSELRQGPSRSSPAAHGLTDFLSNPSQRIAS